MGQKETDRDLERLLTIAEAQERLNIGRTKIYGLVHSRAIPALKIGRSVRIKESELDLYIRKLRY